MKKRNISTILQESFLKESIQILSEASLEQLRDKFVGTGPVLVKVGGKQVQGEKLSEKQWQEITDLDLIFGNKKIKIKPNYVIWIASQVAIGNLKDEDIYKYGDTGSALDEKGFLSMLIDPKTAKYMDRKDISLYKTSKEFEDEAKKARELARGAPATGPVEDEGGNFATPEQIQILKDVGIELLGKVNNYQCFKIPKGNGSMETWTPYVRILGQCSHGRVELCTIGDKTRYTNFHTYVQGAKADDMYVFINFSDPNAPYQFHYRDSQFMDRSDNMVV